MDLRPSLSSSFPRVRAQEPLVCVGGWVGGGAGHYRTTLLCHNIGFHTGSKKGRLVIWCKVGGTLREARSQRDELHQQ
jgi:hypothetical protein